MIYKRAKIYNDGSHYIAIPSENFSHDNSKPQTSKGKGGTHKEHFESAYGDSQGLPKSKRNKHIIDSLQSEFNNEQEAMEFVESNLKRKTTNTIKRRVRLMRKVYLQEWNYFCTFTYDNTKLNEDSFKEKLRNTLKHLVYRKQWKYIGAWECSPNKRRLHFHGIFYIPQMIGELKAVTDYDTRNHRRQITYQNTHFLKYFGRNDFKELGSQADVVKSVRYLMKYITKSNEKLAYGGKLPTYFISDVVDDDIACKYGVDNKKAVLFDDFTCYEDGEIIGTVCRETLESLPKSN